MTRADEGYSCYPGIEKTKKQEPVAYCLFSIERIELWEPEKYVYGHHRDYDSLARARKQGCVACQQLSENNDEDDINEVFAARGYYSVFAVTLSQSTQPEMTIYVGEGEEPEYIPCELVEHDCKSRSI